MKEDMLDVLLYLFQNYISDDVTAETDRDVVLNELVEAGFPSREVSQAFEWLDGLAERQATALKPFDSERSFRVYTAQELGRLDVECRGYLLVLEQMGVLDTTTRELVIDRVMALETDDIDLNDLKWIILMVLFNRPGQEEAYAWMEDQLFDEVVVDYLH